MAVLFGCGRSVAKQSHGRSVVDAFCSPSFCLANMFQAPSVEQKDLEVSEPPGDSTQCLAFSPTPRDNEEILAVGSWDNNVRLKQFVFSHFLFIFAQVRIYKIDQSGKSSLAGVHAYQAPVFDLCWSKVRKSITMP